MFQRATPLAGTGLTVLLEKVCQVAQQVCLRPKMTDVLTIAGGLRDGCTHFVAVVTVEAVSLNDACRALETPKNVFEGRFYCRGAGAG
jgi:hypothetical protein